MPFQDIPSGVLDMEVVTGRPQSKNELNYLIKGMESAASDESIKAGFRFSNFTVDGVSYESSHVWLTIYKFLH